MTNTKQKITFVGAGNMAKSIVGGLIEKGYPAVNITLCSPTEQSLLESAQSFGTLANINNAEGVADADIVVLAVKPAKVVSVCAEIKEHISSNTLVISVAAGITCEAMTNALGENHPIVRCMPNTPSLVGQGAAGLFANLSVSEEQKQTAESIMRAVGIVSWVKEETLIDTVTAVSGSGPAYYFLLMEAMIDAAQAQGMDRQTATDLTLQTALGAATLAKASDVSVDELRRRVTSPNGTTEQALNTFEANNLRDIVAKALNAAENRSKELAKEFSQ